ncbi:MAG: cysteine synthase A [Sphingomonadales bacterium]|nr:cysteine synthase A [Sphingomonadales bacterium]
MRENVLELIGNTPLVKLRRASEETGCLILGKAEFMNPGGSIKDRAALYIIEDAEKKGLIKPGGTIVEGTAGNTGIGIAIVANAKGYRTKIVMPETQSEEKKATLRALGAELILVPPAPFKSPNHFVHTSSRLADEMNAVEAGSALWANQFDNVANRDAHIHTTAPEIWADTDGKVDAFVSAVGSGGTLTGTAMGLKAKNKDITIALADPFGAAMYHYFAHGELKSEGNSIAEGIGQGRITANLEGAPVDAQYQISDQEGLDIVFNLVKEEGLCVGLSTGINVAGAIKLAKDMGPGKTIVTMLCDTGLRYTSRLFNREFLESKGLNVPDWIK